MSDEIEGLRKRVEALQREVEEIKKERGIMTRYLDTLATKSDVGSAKQAIQTLVEALARVAHGSPHLSAEEQAKIKKLLGHG